MSVCYHIHGGTPLKGDVIIGGSKNAALPLIAASILFEGETVLTNVPHIRDTESMVHVLEFLGADVHFEENTLRISTRNLQSRPIPADLVSKFRASILVLGPLLTRFGVVEMAYPGGCVIGKRPVHAHISVLTQLGAVDMSTDDVLHLQGSLKAGRVILPEFSVTATENAILAAALIDGEVRMDLAACEPHVQDVCRFLSASGVKIEGIGSHTLRICGTQSLQTVPHAVTSDYLEAGAFISAALATKGKLNIHNVDYEHLVFFLEAVRRAGGVWTYDNQTQVLHVDGDASSLQGTNVQTNIFPGFPTDLLPPFGVVLTQAKGVSRLFEVLFEGRMAYLYELESMGAHVEFLNSHQALIIGPTPLRGRMVASNDIRAGAAMVVAALCAEDKTTITDVQYIERGYDRLHEKLKKLGANIERIEEAKSEERRAKSQKIEEKLTAPR
jgi:UDP-N-acetylglucosamine 1-carboxyvinyltransferase